MDLNLYIKDIVDFPKKGIVFKDISPLLANPEAFSYVIDNIASKYNQDSIDKIVGLDARGFILAPLLLIKLAYRLSWSENQANYPINALVLTTN